jgi:hypothetical protein
VLVTIAGIILLSCLVIANVHLARIVHLLRKLVAMQAETNALAQAKIVRHDVER